MMRLDDVAVVASPVANLKVLQNAASENRTNDVASNSSVVRRNTLGLITFFNEIIASVEDSYQGLVTSNLADKKRPSIKVSNKTPRKSRL